jgi:hypothetical protein
MSAPFIALTMPLAGFDPQPIFINALHVRTAHPRFVRKAGACGKGLDAHDEDGTWICVGSGEEGTFPVCESYGEVTSAIRDALPIPPPPPFPARTKGIEHDGVGARIAGGFGGYRCSDRRSQQVR